MSSFNFKNSLVIDNNTHLKWLDSTNSRANILVLDASDNVYVNSINTKSFFLNSVQNSSTFINASNGNNTVFGSKIGVGLLTDSQIGANVTLVKNGFIGLSGTLGSNDGFLGIAGSHSLSTTGSRIILYGVDAANPLAGSLNIHGGANSGGSVNIYTQESLKLKITTIGNVLFSPNGSTIVVDVGASDTSFHQRVLITDTSDAINGSSGCLVLNGGISIAKDCRVNGTLSINEISGNLNFNSTQVSSSYTTGAVWLSGGLGINTTVGASSITSGGGISCAGGIAIGQNLIVGKTLNVQDSTDSSNSQDGSIVTNGGIGINGKLNIRTSTSHIRLAPSVNQGTTLVDFLDANDFTGTAWNVRRNADNFGISFSTSSNLVLVTSGNVGINTSSPQSKLDVSGNARIQSTEQSSGVGTGGAFTVLGGTSISKDLYVGGAMTSSSDARLKHDIIDLEGDFLQKIQSLRTVMYTANDDPDNNRQYGFIAQDFEQEFPELVRRRKGGMYTLDYQKMTVVLLKCVKELAHVCGLGDKFQTVEKGV
jgi:hypothetical protein